VAWVIHEGELDHEDVRALLAQHFDEMRAGSPPSACHVLPVDGLKDPAIRFFTLRGGGTLLGCGALKMLETGHGEIKSMRTANAALGRGVGKAMLDHLVATAREEGMTRLSLETGSTEQFAAALRLYEREGFDRCGPFGAYADTPFTRFFTREIWARSIRAAKQPCAALWASM
jgi:putative acetyltransferase